MLFGEFEGFGVGEVGVFDGVGVGVDCVFDVVGVVCVDGYF